MSTAPRSRAAAIARTVLLGLGTLLLVPVGCTVGGVVGIFIDTRTAGENQPHRHDSPNRYVIVRKSAVPTNDGSTVFHARLVSGSLGEESEMESFLLPKEGGFASRNYDTGDPRNLLGGVRFSVLSMSSDGASQVVETHWSTDMAWRKSKYRATRDRIEPISVYSGGIGNPLLVFASMALGVFGTTRVARFLRRFLVKKLSSPVRGEPVEP